MKAVVAVYEGQGMLADPEKKFPVRYELKEYEERNDAGEAIPGRKRAISGTVSPTNQERLVITRDPYLLRCEDGREISGFVVDEQGGFRCAGGFFSK